MKVQKNCVLNAINVKQLKSYRILDQSKDPFMALENARNAQIIINKNLMNQILV